MKFIRSIFFQMYSEPITFLPVWMYLIFLLVFISDWIVSGLIAYNAFGVVDWASYYEVIILDKLKIPRIFSGLDFAIITSALFMYLGLINRGRTNL